jgi:hypothetical protein
MTESFTSPQTREQVRLDFAERVEPRGDDAAERRDVSGRRTADSDKTTRGSRPSTGRTRSRRRQLFRRNLLPGVLSQSRKGTESEGHGAENAADGEFFIADERHLYNMGIHVKQELNLSRLAALVVTSPAPYSKDLKESGSSWQQGPSPTLSDKPSLSEVCGEQPWGAIPDATEKALERLCLLWIARKTGASESSSNGLRAVLSDPNVFLHIAGIDAPCSGDARNLDSMRRCIQLFLDSARNAGLDANALFEPEDVIEGKNLHLACKVLCAYAEKTDSEAFTACMKQVGLQRRNYEEIIRGFGNDSRPGCATVNQLVDVVRAHSPFRDATILFAGTIGAGKSATINRILGSPVARTNHTMALILSDDEILERDPEHGLEVIEERSYEREREQRAHPNRKTEFVPSPNENVLIYPVEKEGMSLRLIEIPSSEKYFYDEAGEDSKKWSRAGTCESVAAALRGLEIDIVCIIERLDSYRSHCFRLVLEELKSLFDGGVWERCILVFTHGYALPPEGLTFEENLARRMHLAQEEVHRVSGRRDIFIPVCVVENSESCPRDSAGNLILPNGISFLDRFVTIGENVFLRNRDRPRLKVRSLVPSHVRVRHIGFILSSVLILQMLRNGPQDGRANPLARDKAFLPAF